MNPGRSLLCCFGRPLPRSAAHSYCRYRWWAPTGFFRSQKILTAAVFRGRRNSPWTD